MGSVIKVSRKSGVKPNVSQISFDQLSWNIVDGILYGKGLDENGDEIIIQIGGSGSSGTSDHARQHQLSNPLDHAPVLEEFRNSIVGINSQGIIHFLTQIFSTNYQTIEEPPDVSTVPVGDSWTHPFKVEEYRLIEQNGQRWWVETTSPKLILTRIFDHTFDKSFN